MKKYYVVAIVAGIISARWLGFQSFSFVIPLLALLGVHYPKEDKSVWVGLLSSEVILGISAISILTLPLFYLIYKCSSLTKRTTVYTLFSILAYNLITNSVYAIFFMDGKIMEALVTGTPFLMKQLVSGMIFYAICQFLGKKYLYPATPVSEKA